MKSETPTGVRERRDTRMRFEQWAHNPRCEANAFSAVYGIAMSDVAKAEGLTPTMGQSPFALARGLNFERVLFRNGAQRLRDALSRAGIVREQGQAFADLRLRINGGLIANLDDALSETAALLMDIADDRGGERQKPAIIGGATVRLPGQVMIPEAILIVDIVAVRYQTQPVTLTVGEIKTYPDRGGYTDSSDLAAARAQAGVYVHGLRTVIAELAISDKLVVSDTGFLVLSRPGSNQPSVRAGEDLRF